MQQEAALLVIETSELPFCSIRVIDSATECLTIAFLTYPHDRDQWSLFHLYTT